MDLPTDVVAPVPRPRVRAGRWVVTGLVVVLVAAVLVVTAGVGAALWAWSRSTTSTVGELSFEQPLAIPPLLDGTEIDGTTRFDLRLGRGSRQFLEGVETPTWGINGDHLGPTLRLRRGDTVRMDVANDLPESTSLHWHGMHLPSSMDGGPHQPIAPGSKWAPRWQVDQPAATLWYHPHLHGSTADHVGRGLLGMILIEDERSGDLGLPDTYGVDDIPVVIGDARIGDDGELDLSTPFMSPAGFLGDRLLVNGTHDPHLEVTSTLVRLRVLNASPARSYDLGLDDGRAFRLVATDNGLLERPITTDRVPVSPGERVELVVEVEPGERAILRSFGGARGLDVVQRRLSGGDDTFDVLQLRAADELRPSTPVPQRLVEQHRLDPADATVTRHFDLGGRQINGAPMDMTRIDEVVEVGTTELWEVSNDSGQFHNFHVHDVRFGIVDVDGHAPPPHLSGWKDTVPVAPGSTVRLIMRFEDFTDATTPYMYHCHLLAHEDDGMMGQFVVVRPGQAAARLDASESHAGHGPD